MAKGKYQEWLTPDGLLLLAAWARDGLSDEQIAKNCGITATTLYVWKDKYPEISESLKRGKDVVDIEVENALFKRAVGYEYEEIMIEESDDGFKKRVTKKFMSPDTTAQIFWLRNRKRGEWSNKPQPDGDGELSKVDQIMENISDEAKS